LLTFTRWRGLGSAGGGCRRAAAVSDRVPEGRRAGAAGRERLFDPRWPQHWSRAIEALENWVITHRVIPTLWATSATGRLQSSPHHVTAHAAG
jgi:hypothetical protein